VTVAYRDDAADDVWVIGGLAGADPSDRRMRRTAGGWWERTYELPRDVRTAYWFTKVLVPTGAGELITDALNPRVHVYPADPEIPGDEGVTASLLELPGAGHTADASGTDIRNYGGVQGLKELRERTDRPAQTVDSIDEQHVVLLRASIG